MIFGILEVLKDVYFRFSGNFMLAGVRPKWIDYFVPVVS